MTGAEIVTALVAALPIIERIFRKVWETQDDQAMAWAFISSHLSSEVAALVKPVFDAAWTIFNDSELEMAWAYLKTELQRGHGITRASIPNLDADTARMHEIADEAFDIVPPHKRDVGGFDAPDPFAPLTKPTDEPPTTEPPPDGPPTLRPEDM